MYQGSALLAALCAFLEAGDKLYTEACQFVGYEWT